MTDHNIKEKKLIGINKLEGELEVQSDLKKIERKRENRVLKGSIEITKG
ncbi:MAG: hypothetical protein Q9M94_07050 [Candidatus Gracilibacteria bacterium]|nr:hypothetical protein [Candidatus Gracilibacteria bacterium]MDQ7023917.1 hypothetical protein [Candidatus Gracilibacteria bacterium]